jgi:hypothetical protein
LQGLVEKNENEIESIRRMVYKEGKKEDEWWEPVKSTDILVNYKSSFQK